MPNIEEETEKLKALLDDIQAKTEENTPNHRYTMKELKDMQGDKRLKYKNLKKAYL
jgi:hypothetical protein